MKGLLSDKLTSHVLGVPQQETATVVAVGLRRNRHFLDHKVKEQVEPRLSLLLHQEVVDLSGRDGCVVRIHPWAGVEVVKLSRLGRINQQGPMGATCMLRLISL